jgi:predicted transcriptional regulator YdeE
MEPKLVQVAPFLVSGRSIRTTNADEGDPNKGKIPGLWKAFMEEWQYGKVPFASGEDWKPYGVYCDYESDMSGSFDLTVGRKVTKPAEDGDWRTLEVAGWEYLLFERTGEMPQTVIGTWMEIWKYFEENPSRERKYLTDFEAYPDNQTVAIYIGVK